MYNLAAQSFVQTSFNQPVLTGEITALGVTRLLDAIRIVDPTVRFYQASSSEMFGKVQEVPQTERTPFYPRSPYGVAKVYGHWITVNYRESYDLHASSRHPVQPREPAPRPRVRPPQGEPRRRPDQARPRRRSCALGNLDAERDWGFAGDYVEAMWLMLQQDEPDDFVVATGETHSVRELLRGRLRPRRPDWEDHVVIDEKFMRPAEVDLLIGDPTHGREDARLAAARRRFQELVTMMVDADIELLTGRLQGHQLISDVTVLAGGVGAARLLAGLVQVVHPAELTAIVNVGDDVELHGLHISPDLDTDHLHLAGAIDPERGWGLAGETWHAMDGARPATAARSWFNLGDRDLATHLYRTDRLRAGATLTRGDGGDRRGLGARAAGCCPSPTTPCARWSRCADEGEIGFQEYFVQRHHDVAVTAVRFDGAEAARPGPGVLDALADAERVVIAPVEPDRVDRPGARRARACGTPSRPGATTSSPSRRSSPGPPSRARPTGCCASSATSRPWSAWPASTRRWPPPS